MDQAPAFSTRDSDVGLGTTYERFALNAWLSHLIEEYPVSTVLEGPGDGVAGIPGVNSLTFGLHKINVVVVLDDPSAVRLARRAWQSQGCLDYVRFACTRNHQIPSADEQFDLVWSFNRLPFLEPTALLAEMARLSRQYVALVVPNRRNYGFPARRLYHRRTGIPWPYGKPAVMEPGAVHRLVEQAGLRVLETRWLDVPWWPDILDPRAWLAAMAPWAARALARAQLRDGYRWNSQSLPYYDPLAHRDLHHAMRRLGWMERRWPAFLQTPFAHHFAVLAVKAHAHA